MAAVVATPRLLSRFLDVSFSLLLSLRGDGKKFARYLFEIVTDGHKEYTFYCSGLGSKNVSGSNQNRHRESRHRASAGFYS